MKRIALLLPLPFFWVSCLCQARPAQYLLAFPPAGTNDASLSYSTQKRALESLSTGNSFRGEASNSSLKLSYGRVWWPKKMLRAHLTFLDKVKKFNPYSNYTRYERDSRRHVFERWWLEGRFRLFDSLEEGTSLDVALKYSPGLGEYKFSQGDVARNQHIVGGQLSTGFSWQRVELKASFELLHHFRRHITTPQGGSVLRQSSHQTFALGTLVQVNTPYQSFVRFMLEVNYLNNLKTRMASYTVAHEENGIGRYALTLGKKVDLPSLGLQLIPSLTYSLESVEYDAEVSTGVEYEVEEKVNRLALDLRCLF